MKIPYSVVRKGHRYFQPHGRMLQLGFRPKPLGVESEASRRAAWDLYERWIAVREGRLPAPNAAEKARKLTKEVLSAAKVYPKGSCGAAWQEWIATEEWKKLSAGTRNKIWWEAWNKRIEPVFGNCHPNSITMSQISDWRLAIETESGIDASHKGLKTFRAFWRVMQALRYTQLSDPSLKVTNTAPKPRDQRFSYGEAIRLAKTAWREGYRGLACIIMTTWDTGFSPKDARTAQKRHLGEDAKTKRYIIDRTAEGRHKTGVAVIGTMSKFGDWMVRQYLKELGADLLEDAFLFRMRRGGSYGESRLGNDFAKIREIALPGDKRQLRDMRRSGVLEVFIGGGEARDVSEKFGNSIDRSSFLFKTYNPVDLEKVKQADEKRLEGRRRKNKS